MDKSSPVFENFENKMSAMSGRPKINKTTFKIGSGDLAMRVANNEKKITTLKNIFKTQRIEIGEKITPKVNVLEESLIKTNEVLADVASQLERDFSQRLNEQKDILKDIDNVIFLGCGTSYFAGLFGVSYFKYLCKFNVLQIFDGAEFTLEDIPLIGNTLLIFLSQSGETKDLHRCVELGRDNNLFMLGVTNVVDSMIAREVHCGTYLNSGREVGVASTKCFTSQVIALNLIALWFSKFHKTGENKRIKVLKDLRNLPQDIKKCVKYCDEIIKKEKITEIFHKNNSMFVLGKGQCEATAKDGSLKIKEISYYHAEGYSGSSLKHGPFALLDKDFPVILIAPNDKYYSKMKSVYQEIKSREASILLITDNKNCKIDNYSKTIVIPNNDTFSSLLSIIP